MLNAPRPSGLRVIPILSAVVAVCAALVRPAAAAELTLALGFDPAAVSVVPAPLGGVAVRLESTEGFASGQGNWPARTVFVAIPDGMASGEVLVTGADPVPVDLVTHELAARFGAPARDSIATAGTKTGEEWMRGRRLLMLRVQPLVWDADSRGVQLYTRVDIHVMLHPEPMPADVWRPVRRGTAAEAHFVETLKLLVANPEDVTPVTTPIRAENGRIRAQSYSAPVTSPLYRPTVDGGPVSLVIITSEALKPEFDRLAEWRMRSGTTTVVRTVEWIESAYPEGVDVPDKIRHFIRDAASLWGTEYVLLGGDTDHVPIRYGRTQYFGGDDIPTDLYYQCLDRTWNENGNQFFGEGAASGALGPDNADLLPEVFAGRIPLSTAAGVRAVIDKTFQYERTPPLDRNYDRTFLGLAEVLQPFDWNPGDSAVFDGGDLCESAISQLPAGYRPVRLYENYAASKWKGTALPETKRAALDSMSAGFSIVNHVGHGFWNNLSMGLGGEDVFSPDVDLLSNAAEPFLFFGINCNSAAVDFDCIAEHFLANTHGGAFAYVGSTRFDFPGSGDSYQDTFFQRIFENMPLAKVHALAKLSDVPQSGRDGANRWHQFSLIYLGDPMAVIRSGPARLLSVVRPASVTLGAPVEVSVAAGGLPLSGARVTLYKAGEVFSSDTTAALGVVTLPCPAETPGDLSVVVTAANALPNEGVVPITAPATGPSLRVTHLTIDDTSGGNGDGRLDAGESAALRFTVRNDGPGGAAGVVLSFNTDAPGITVVHTNTDLGDIPAGAADSVESSQVIRVSVNPSLGPIVDVPGSLTLSWSGGSRMNSVAVHVGGASLWIAGQTVSGDPESVDGVSITPQFLNRGQSPAQNVRVRLTTSTLQVTLITPAVEIGTIAPGATGSPAEPLRFHCPSTAVDSVQMIIEAGGLDVGQEVMDITPPPKPAAPLGYSKPRAITLVWPPVIDSGLRGYAVFRSSAAGGPWAQANGVVDNPMGIYEDSGLSPLTRYYYRVAALDRAGNLGPASDVVSVLTSFPSLANWPLTRASGTPSSPVVHDLNGDGKLEILIGGEEIYAIHADGTEYADGDGDSRTLGVLTRTSSAQFWATPAVADLGGDGILDIVCAGFADGKLYVFGPDGAVRPGWPRAIGTAGTQLWGSPLVVDTDGDGRMEIYIPGERYLYGFHWNGTEIRDGDSNPATIGPLVDLGGGFNYGTPAAADFDHDGHPDVVVGTRSGRLFLMRGDGTPFPGFPRDMGGAMTGSPAIADLNNDGELEMIVPIQMVLEVQAINRFGVSPWPGPVHINVNQDIDASPTVADLDGDGYPDVVMVGGTGQLSAWHGQNGQLLTGFPVDLRAQENAASFAVRGTPCLGDVDGDGHPDIVVGTQTGTVYGVSRTGQLVPGFPLRALANIEGGPLLWDIDGDGHTNIVFGSVDGKVYALDTPGIFDLAANTCPWPMFRHDQRNSGSTATTLSTPVAPALTSLTIQSEGEEVLLKWWVPGDALNGAAWHVYRRELPAGGEERLTAAAISDQGGAVTFADRTARPGAHYEYSVEAIDRSGKSTRFAGRVFEVPDRGGLPMALRQNVPNPFSGTTSIAFVVPAGAGSAGAGGAGGGASAGPGAVPVRLAVFDIRGRLVTTLVDGSRAPGAYDITWDGRDSGGRRAANGVFFYRLTTPAGSLTQRMILVRDGR